METVHRKFTSWRNPWSSSFWTIGATLAALALLATIGYSFTTWQLDPKGCAMCYMRPSFVKYTGFDTEHTPFASKYSLYLYREGVIDEDPKLKGVPVLFIPGNAGSYKQVRPLAAEAAYHWHDALQYDAGAIGAGKRPLDFFSVDFNEDITAFHGQTLLDQAQYLNDAILYILSLYHDPSQSNRDRDLPDPSSVILVGHSMGGIVARTMLIMPNYQPNSVNTILTLAAPHARPPVSFDGEIVRIYSDINHYWRHSYSQNWANDNPLWHVTLISIAGGGLDTIVPSDYASVASLVPDTHGFTVFASTIPNVWTGMDHLAITWCNQLRKSIVRALYDVVDVNRPAQTTRRAERMTTFKKWFLTGLEDAAEKSLQHQDTNILLTIEDESTPVESPGGRLTLRNLGDSKRPQAYLIPVPLQGASDAYRFTLLSDQKLDFAGGNGKLEVLFCSVFPQFSGQVASGFDINIDLSHGTEGPKTRMACKDSAADTIILPASTGDSVFPFDDRAPFSYLQYSVNELSEHQFVAILDKSYEVHTGFLLAEFSSDLDSVIRSNDRLEDLVAHGLNVELPAKRPLSVDVKIPALKSSLLAYTLRVTGGTCMSTPQLFAPFVRQYVSDVHESKFFTNVKETNINVHGVAPYMPPNLEKGTKPGEGLALQIWTDPTCENPIELHLNLDILGSMGKLWMRYRFVFAAFPLLVVALILRKQFKIYDQEGVFMSFSEALNQCLKTSLPVLILALTFFSTSLARASMLSAGTTSPYDWFLRPFVNTGGMVSAIDYSKNDFLLGFQDAFFWFLVPLFGLISTGICVLLNFTVLTLTHIFALIYGKISYVPLRNDNSSRRGLGAFASTRRRVLFTGILLLLVSTVIPYHFAYVVLCIVQVATCTRAYRLAQDTGSAANYNFYNYTHSILVFMLWILPINIPVLVVWLRNLAIQWATPFSSHHNILLIMPIILLVETLTTGRMIPRVTTKVQYLTNMFLFGLAVYAAVFGITRGYILHHLANALCAWLVVIHASANSISASTLTTLLDRRPIQYSRPKKRP
ncbi:GPI inositol-deacylase [Pseudovirgaria hyperparasitica]|uniref:GPI inositol-deacylase n=1 Tax=Pseudovirgaria hyperparasitica TaxID=470096 RepID=A0A6A6WG50_9PEZI|nr:GPI inositol-deacylase [Pseudovirgaria hyperparasitica]KAF2760597.1 GPI inositol-deacylase [Pseudovirgaria hyperparasitica]